MKDLKAFYQAMSEDAELQKEYEALGTPSESEIVAFAAKKGYTFTVVDLKRLSEAEINEINAAGEDAGIGRCFVKRYPN